MGNLEKPSRLRELRHQVARLKTVLKERENEKASQEDKNGKQEKT